MNVTSRFEVENHVLLLCAFSRHAAESISVQEYGEPNTKTSWLRRIKEKKSYKKPFYHVMSVQHQSFLNHANLLLNLQCVIGTVIRNEYFIFVTTSLWVVDTRRCKRKNNCRKTKDNTKKLLKRKTYIFLWNN